MKPIRNLFAAVLVALSFSSFALPAHAASMSDYLENKVIDWLFRGQTFTPSATWGTVTELCVYDALTTGNLLWRVGLTTPKTINTGDTVSFPAASLTFQIDN